MARFNLRFVSKSLLRKTEVNLIVPSLSLHGALAQPNPHFYREDDERFPLVILLSGFGDDNEAWLMQTDIVNLCDKYRVAVALVGGENKWYLNASATDNWQEFISCELPDFLYGNFRRLNSSKQPVIGGVSMGGYGALHSALCSPNSFSAVMALSPATKPDDIIDESMHGTLKELFVKTKGTLPLTYISIGDRDFIYQASKDLDNWLAENNIGVNYKFVPNYAHSWDLWKVEVDNFLQLLKDKKII